MSERFATLMRRSAGAHPAAALAVLIAASVGCAADPEDPARGSCSLSCSQPRVAATEFKVKPLIADQAVTVRCSGPGELNGPVQVRYKIYEESTPVTLPTGGASLQENGGGAGGGVMEQPKAGIGFEPVVMGGVSIDRTTDEFKSDGGSVTPWKFAGVVTPSSEWCSDSCGVMTFEFWPSCGEDGNDVVAGVYAGAAQVSQFLKFTFSAPPKASK
jgi:hypothetical protein